MQVKYAVKNIVKEGPICQNVEKIFTSARMGAGRGGISGATRPPAGLSMAMFMPAAIGSAAQNAKNAWTLVKKAPVGTSSLTLDQAAERFLADKQDKLKQSTLARYAYMLEHYILPALGVVLVCQLTANQISDFLLRLQKGGLSGKSARDVGVLLKSILRYSAKKLDCTSPGLAVELPAYRRKQIDIFYPDEIQRLAQKIMDKPTTAGIGILLTLNTGLRLGELCALQYKDIDLRNGVIHITKTVQRIRSGDCTCLMVLPPKSDSARRTIPLPGDMAALLKKIIQSHPNGENYLLTGKSAPMEPRTMQYQYRTLLKAAGIPYRNFHVLRHTYASRCVERGVDVKSLSEMLGHADVRTTLQVYVHSSLEHKMRVIQSICFLAPALTTEVTPSPSPSGFPETPQYQQLLAAVSQMG